MRTFSTAVFAFIGCAWVTHPASAQSGAAAPTGSGPVPAQVMPAPPAPEPYARFNRLAFSLGFGFGSASMGRLHEGASALMRTSNLSGDTPESGLQINAELAFRYYFPYYVMAQVGYGAVYNWASSEVSQGLYRGTLSNHNLVMEVPILVGGYYPFIRRLYVYGLVGPTVFFFPHSWWDIDPGGAPDVKAGPGVGFHCLVGADYLFADHFALGLELRYRYLKTGELKEVETGTAWVDGSGEGYDLDFSGISLGLVLRFYVM